MSKLEMILSLLTWIRLMIGHFLEGWAFFTRKIESVMSVKVCPWWRSFNMRSITCNWSRYSVPRKSWNRRLEQVSTLDFSCLRLSIFVFFFHPFVERCLGVLILKLTRSRICFKCTWDSRFKSTRARWGSEPGVKLGGWRKMYWCSFTFESATSFYSYKQTIKII